VDGDERWTAVTGLTTDVPNIETIRQAAVCQKKRNYDQKKERPRNIEAAPAITGRGSIGL